MRSSTRSAVGLVHAVDDLAVGEEQHLIGVARGDRVVGHHHDGLTEPRHRVAEEREDLRAGPAVEVAGGLVAEDDLRLAGEGPGHRHPLLLAARQLARAMVQTVGETDGLLDLLEPLLVGLAAGEVHREGDVLACRQGRDQVVGLEDEPDLVPTQQGQLLLGEAGSGRRRR